MCYNAVWLLVEITDQAAGETLAEEALVAIEVQIDRCLRQPAVTAEKNVKCHSNQQAASLFIAGIVFELWEEILIQGATTEAHQGQILAITTEVRPIPSIKNNLKR